jgi:hypothetical protein
MLPGRSLDLVSDGEARGMIVATSAAARVPAGTEFGLRLAANVFDAKSPSESLRTGSWQARYARNDLGKMAIFAG